MSDELWEAAVEQFVENFIDEHDREPIDEEIEKGAYNAYTDYVSGLADRAYDAWRDDQMTND